jgi:transcriptional regulator with XRE-family HTH domain
MHHMNIHRKYKYTCGGFALFPDASNILCIMNIARIRKSKGLNQTDLAEMAGVTQPSISRAEKGDDGVTLGNFKQIAAALGVQVKDLFDDERTPIEQAVLDAYRNLSPERQKGWQEALGIAESLEKS